MYFIKNKGEKGAHFSSILTITDVTQVTKTHWMVSVKPSSKLSFQHLLLSKPEKLHLRRGKHWQRKKQHPKTEEGRRDWDKLIAS